MVRTVNFFEPPPRPPEPPQQRWRQPVWLGPPDNAMGGVVALELLAAHSEKAAVWIEAATAYPSGVEFEIEVRWRPEVFEIVQRGAPWHYQPSLESELPDALFRAGFELADGSKVTTLATGLSAPAPVAIEGQVDQEPGGPVLMPRGGSGGGQSWSHGLWLWPLPPEGPLTFVCEWPALGIALARAEIETARIHDAAGRSKTLWEDTRPPLSGPGPIPL